MKYVHLLLRAVPPQQPFNNFDFACRTWTRLQHNFPNALAAMLMPNHVHLLISLPETSPPLLAESLAQAQSKLRGVFQTPEFSWEKMPAPQMIPDRAHLRRLWRYIALNPMRKGLARDPLVWPWSTYRDLFVASYPQWISNESLAAAMGEHHHGVSVRLHDFASKDETVHVHGTKAPHPSPKRKKPFDPMEQLLYALAASMRMRPERVLSKTSTRRALIRFAKRQGWGHFSHHTMIARFCGVHPRTIRRAFDRVHSGEDALMKAAARCLGDARLTEFLHWE